MVEQFSRWNKLKMAHRINNSLVQPNKPIRVVETWAEKAVPMPKIEFFTETKVEPGESKIELYLKDNLKNEMFKGFVNMAYNPHIVTKLFWTIVLMATFGLTSYLVVMPIFTYLEFGVHTTARTIFETPAVFPKVTVCNYNLFQTEYAVEFLKETNREVAPYTDLFNQTQMAYLNYSEKNDLIKLLYKTATSKVLSPNFTDENRKQLGHSLDDILKTCWFNGEACSPDDFVWTFDTYYGNCYVFNSGFNSSGDRIDLKKSYIAGSVFGLQIAFYLGFHENLTLFNSINSKGAYVRIENSSYLSDMSLDDGVYLAPGKWVNVLLNRNFKFVLEKPYSNCDLANGEDHKETKYELVNLIAKSQYQYTQQACFYLCIQKKILETCNCTYAYYLSLFDAPQCQILDCFYKVLAYFFENDFIQENCMTSCPLECNRTELVYTVSQIELMGELTVDFIKENPNLAADFVTMPVDAEKAQDSVSQISIFYYSLTYTLSTETAQMDLVALLAAIGGNLGLFMGVSALSFCELIDVLLEVYYFKKEKK